jgi:hypothetical protein
MKMKKKKKEVEGKKEGQEQEQAIDTIISINSIMLKIYIIHVLVLVNSTVE